MIGKWQWGARWIYNVCLGTMLAWGVGEKKYKSGGLKRNQPTLEEIG